MHERNINPLPLTRSPRGPGPQPRHVPWQGIEPAAFRLSGWCSICWATILARANHRLFKYGLEIPSKILYEKLKYIWILRNHVFPPLSYTDEDSVGRRGSATCQGHTLSKKRWLLIPSLACWLAHHGTSCSVGNTQAADQHPTLEQTASSVLYSSGQMSCKCRLMPSTAALSLM